MLSDVFLAASDFGKLRFVTPFLIAVHAVLNSSGEAGDDATPAAADIASLMRSATRGGQ